MSALGCKIMCKSCGVGHVVRLPDDGIYYVLTDDNTIIWRGICGHCEEGVSVERSIVELLMMCPTKTDTKAN